MEPAGVCEKKDEVGEKRREDNTLNITMNNMEGGGSRIEGWMEERAYIGDGVRTLASSACSWASD